MKSAILLLFIQLLESTFGFHGSNFRIGNDSYYLEDDILLTAEQHDLLRERGFFLPGKWPMVDGVVTVPFFFSPYSFPSGSPVQSLFYEAIETYRRETCIEWVEVDENDPQHKVEVFAGMGCFSSIGMVPAGNRLSLAAGCWKHGVILHEMGHTMGLFHAQSRPDRNNFIKLWPENIAPNMLFNFQISSSATFGIPYDYMSIMHYGPLGFSTNGRFTMTSIKPFYQFKLGQREKFRYSDKAMLNFGYECPEAQRDKCPRLDCQNGGFLGRDCQCVCPENTDGSRCERVFGNFYSEKPECGGAITSPQIIQSDGYGTYSTDKKCVYWIQAPDCYRVKITMQKAMFYGSCSSTMLAVKTQEDRFDDYFCDSRYLWEGYSFTSDNKEAIVYFYNNIVGSSQYGFSANVEFIPSGECKPSVTFKPLTETTTKQATTIPTTTTATTTSTMRTTTPREVTEGQCSLVETGENSFQYSTYNYPSETSPGTFCQLARGPKDFSEIKFSRVLVLNELKNDDALYIQDVVTQKRLTGRKREEVIYVLWPFELKFNAGNLNGNGFQASFSPSKDLPTPCNGETVQLKSSQPTYVDNPLVYSENKRGLPCVFKFEAPKGKKIRLNVQDFNPAPGEYLAYSRFVPSSMSFDYFDSTTKTPVVINSNYVIIYYVSYPSVAYTLWSIEANIVE